MDVLLNIPVWLYTGIYHIWWLLQELPWPAGKDVFKATATFIALYPARIIMGAVMPEKTAAKRVRKRFIDKQAVQPSKTEHQAAASITSIFHH